MNPRTTGLLLLVAVALGAFVWFYEIQGEAERERAQAQEEQLFPEIEAAEIQAVELRTSDGVQARLERREGGFALVEPLAFPADTFAAEGITSNLAGLERASVIEDPQPPEEYGLGDGAQIIRFTAGDETHVLRLGDDTPVGATAYASVEGQPEVFAVPRFAANSFEKSLADLRERRILDFDPASIRRIELAWPGERVVLERTPAPAEAEAGAEADPAGDGAEEPAAAEPAEGAWRMVEPVVARADADAVDQLLSDLAFLRAEGFVDDPPGAAAAGLAPPAFEVTLSGPPPAEGAEAPAAHLEIGAVHEGDARLVRAAQPSLYTIPADRFEALPRRVAAYRDRQLSRFAAADAEQVDLYFRPAAGDPVAVKAVREEGTWKSSPVSMAPGRLDRLVAELSDLEAADILAEAPDVQALEALGLSPPNVIVSVFGAADAAQAAVAEPAAGETASAPPRLAEIQIGNVEGSEWIIARPAGDPSVYRLPYELAETLPVSLDALRNRFSVEAGAAPGAGAVAAPGPPAGAEPEFLSPSQESP